MAEGNHQGSVAQQFIYVHFAYPLTSNDLKAQLTSGLCVKGQQQLNIGVH